MTPTPPTAPSPRNQTSFEANPDLPTVRITREFNAARERVFQAWTEANLVSRWLGPNGTTTKIESWDARTGGGYRYSIWRGDEQVASFYGSFHEVRPSQRLVQTFTFLGEPDGVSLETVTFDDLDDGRTRVTTLSVVESLEIRDAIIRSGMEAGVVDSYDQLDALLGQN